jgi:signal peptidase I
MTTDTHPDEDKKPDFVTESVEIVKTVVYALLIALVLRVFLLQPFTIPSASMEPNLYQGDYIIVSKFDYGYSRHSIPFSPKIFSGRLFDHAPTRGDIIVFKLPSSGHVDYIKRLIGLPGDRIQVKAGKLYINDTVVPRNSLGQSMGDLPGIPDLTPVTIYDETFPEGTHHKIQKGGDDGPADNTGVYVVPPHCYFMMGDNRDNSADSRFDPAIPPDFDGATCPWDSSLDPFVHGDEGVGFVPEENLVGRARLILMSWKPGASLFNPLSWFAVRPDRFAKVLH